MTTPVRAQAPSASKGNAPPPPQPYPFPVGVYESTIQDYDQIISLGATVAAWTAPVQLPTWNISPTGWLRGLWLDVTLTITGNAAGSFANDGPWSFFQRVTFYDLGQQIVQQYTGYELMLINKFGGYFEVGDPRADITYSAAPTTTTPFHFILYIPLEAVKRDSLATLQNESRPGYRLEMYADSAANTVSGGTAFTAAGVPSVRVRAFPDSYTEPTAASPSGRPFAQTPPLPGSMQYWRSENNSVPSGSMKFDLSNGVGFPIRNIFWYAKDAANGTRATADGNWPDPATELIGNVTRFVRSKNLWISKMSRSFSLSAVGATVPAADSAAGRENAVFPDWMTEDLDSHPGDELRFKYIDTQVNTLIRFQGSFGAASTMFALTNWIVPSNKNRYSLIGGGGA
jgi:hypothetical protein